MAFPHPLLLTESIRRIEAEALARTAPGELMARAAAAVADAAESRLRAMPAGTPVLAFCGPGNNGGDALLAAILLRERGFDARAFELADACVGANPPADTARVRARAAALGMTPATLASPEALRGLLSGNGRRRAGGAGAATAASPAAAGPAPAPLVIDGLFGIGLARPLQGLSAGLCRLAADLRLAVIAVDVPSGIDADSGAIVGGQQGAAIRASETVTMIADKPGLHTGSALDHAGIVRVATLGLDAVPQDGDGWLFGRADAAALLPDRPRDSSKGSFGSVLVVGGATGMSGAALLAGRAAQCSGAGKVWIASPAGPVFDPAQPQLMTRDADAPFDRVDVIVAGCGLGTGPKAAALIERVLGSGRPVVLDADALNLLATRPVSPAAPLPVLTPHPLEAARLAGCRVADIQADRIGSACRLADAHHAVVVLKGAGTVVAAPGGCWTIVDAGGPALASAGTGDVLAGLIGGLIAQRLPPFEAALLGCWAHGAAADRWTAASGRGAGLSAAELPALARDALAGLALPGAALPQIG